ncbi:exo-beta-N-acetylmuramidase NamZ family protein [Piscibacillus sp. B03]|uniref:exo-beta-N-acetylmuramidase NamZ family protein n=1 Tax=Piscibacillus sp. B03 TaxID=3457430 RepID=UPI003FCDED76
MELGLEIFIDKYIDNYKKQRIGLVTNPTGVNRKLESTIDLLNDRLNLTTLFSPEHGIRADLKEGEEVEDSIDEITGLPIYSLYGETRRPTSNMLSKVDVVIFDIQDIGSRYYTYIYTLAYILEACKEHKKEVIVLDRPNPINGLHVEGNIVKDSYKSFVGLYPLPIRHGMTVGELARLFNKEFDIKCSLTVIPMENWDRSKYFDELDWPWVPPSPNVTGVEMQLLYPGTCLIEGTNLSEARGTVRPFEMIGAPFIDARAVTSKFNDLNLSGVIARPVSFTPTYQKFSGEVCHGIQLHVLDRDEINSFYIGAQLINIIYQMYPADFEFIKDERSDHYFFDLLAGTNELRQAIVDSNLDEYLNGIRNELEAFLPTREKYLIYS